ncbi:MAG: aminotransferase class I/II-fold pyridoxal phosphate-dependent enzyme [Planctomycetota bacterium]
MYEIGAKELNAAKRVIDRRKFFRYKGIEVVAFEKEWAELMGIESATAVTSGTAALIVCLQAMGIGPGDSVLVPGYTFIATALAVTSVGAIPIYTEIDETLTMCPIDMQRKIEKHTACVIPVHMQGMPCNMQAISKIAKANKVLVLEDCCQALGGSYRGKRLGVIGDMGAYSFNQYKILSCGEGGVCVTSNKKYAERAYMAQDGSCSVWPGTGEMSEAFFCGGNYRFNELNAAILLEQVKRLDGILTDIRQSRSMFLAGIELPNGFKFIKSNDEDGNCGVCFLIQAENINNAEKLEAIMKEHIATHRPINSGRHVYSAWGVVNSRIGGHHRDWDCFRHPKNKNIKTNYLKPMIQTDDYLKRTVLCHSPYDWSKKKIKETIEKINKQFANIVWDRS